MLHELHRTEAPSSTRVSISTAVWIVMCRQPTMRAPTSGFAAPNSSRNAISPGISVSAIAISRLPQSASAMSATLWSVGAGIRSSPLAKRRQSRSRKIYTYLYIVNRVLSAGKNCSTENWRRKGAAPGVGERISTRPRSIKRKQQRDRPALITSGGQDAAISAVERRGRDRVDHVGVVGLLSPATGDGCFCPVWRADRTATAAPADLSGTADRDDPALPAHGHASAIRTDDIAGRRAEQRRHELCQCRPVRSAAAAGRDPATAALATGGLAARSLELERRTVRVAAGAICAAAGPDCELGPRLLAARPERLDLDRRSLGIRGSNAALTLARAGDSISGVRRGGRPPPHLGDRVGRRPPGQYRVDAVEREKTHRDPGLGRGTAEMRQQHYILQPEIARVHYRLSVIDIEPGVADMPALQSRDQCPVVHQCAAGGVHHDGSLRQQCNALRIEPVMGGRTARRIERQHLALRQKALVIIVKDCPLLEIGRQTGLVAVMHLHVEGMGHPRHLAADAAHAEG